MAEFLAYCPSMDVGHPLPQVCVGDLILESKGKLGSQESVGAIDDLEKGQGCLGQPRRLAKGLTLRGFGLARGVQLRSVVEPGLAFGSRQLVSPSLPVLRCLLVADPVHRDG